MTGQEPADILRQFLEIQDMEGVDVDHFERILRGVGGSGEALDEALQPFLDRDVAQLDVMERVALRIGAFELLHCPEIPFRVVLDECVDLAHRFGSEQGHTYVNAVLDKAVREWRVHEISNS
jgi:N utilization substance protein B